MAIYTLGSKDEPIERKQRREAFLPKLPDYVPPEVIDESRILLDQGEWMHEEALKRILSDELMEFFWRDLRKKFNKSPYLPIGPIIVEDNWQGLVSRCIVLMIKKGGKLPDMSATAFHNARVGAKNSGVAGEIHRLINKISKPESAYKNIASLNIIDLLEICSKSENSTISGKGIDSISELTRSNTESSTGFNAACNMSFLSPNLLDILKALLEQIETKQPLSLADEWIPSKNIPNLRGENAQRLYFRKKILDAIHGSTSKNCPALAATAENVVFNLPPEKRVTAEDLKDS